MAKPKEKKRAATRAASPRSLATRASPFGAAPHAVRIIGGLYKRTKIPVADVPGLRPTPDRVRETLFNWIAHLMPDLAQARGLDLFAGAGALGFELASRGAAHVTLVERDQRLLANLRTLRERLDASNIEIVAGDAFAVAQRLPEAGFDLILLDPPFDAGLNEPALKAARRLLARDGLVYLESGSEFTAAQAAAAGFEVVRAARAARVHFHLLRPRDAGIIASRGLAAAGESTWSSPSIPERSTR
jgi:16S rRNA (guanine(966)-N(2))-methyltransferase RsmD